MCKKLDTRYSVYYLLLFTGKFLVYGWCKHVDGGAGRLHDYHNIYTTQCLQILFNWSSCGRLENFYTARTPIYALHRIVYSLQTGVYIYNDGGYTAYTHGLYWCILCIDCVHRSRKLALLHTSTLCSSNAMPIILAVTVH